jgi:hypothetical protein
MKRKNEMTTDNFCYWLQGFFELTDSKDLTPEQVEMIKEHLQLTMTKKTSTLLDLSQLGDLPPICNDGVHREGDMGWKWPTDGEGPVIYC